MILPQTLETMQKNWEARRGHFGGFQNECSTNVELHPTKKGFDCAVGAAYVNQTEKIKTFQIGNFTHHAIFKTNMPELQSNAYLEWCTQMLSTAAPLIEHPSSKTCHKNQHQPCDMTDTTINDCSLAMNCGTSGSNAPWSVHHNAKVFGACIASAESDPKLRPLASSKTLVQTEVKFGMKLQV